MGDKKTKTVLGSSEVDITKVCRDIRGVEDIVLWAVENDWMENRFQQFDTRIFPFTDQADVSEWDSHLLDRYTPLYCNTVETCTDCPLGPCNLSSGKGICGLEFEGYQARLSLRKACRGCSTQMVHSRELLDYAIKVFGREKEVSWGAHHDASDLSHIGLFTCIPMGGQNLADLDRALAYAEAQLVKLSSASFTGTDAIEMEGMVFHAGSMLMIGKDVIELIKMSLFGLTNASDHEVSEMIDWPEVNVVGGLGNVEPGKPVITFMGDTFLLAYLVANQLKEKGLTEKVEVCGIGPAGDDLARFYERVRPLAPMTKARKILRYGISDVLVGGSSCMNLDILEDTKRVGTRVIWVSRDKNIGLPDRTDSFVDDIVKDLVAGAPGAWIRLPEKAAEVALKVLQQVKRKGDYRLSEEKAKAEAKKCREDCDLCFSNCPNSLLLSKAVQQVAKEGIKALAEVEKGCFGCGACVKICPENIPLLDLIVASMEKRAPGDKFKLRPGRGPLPRVETSSWAFSSMWGNTPGICHLLGCGDAKHEEDLGWIAYELTARNFITFVAGCAAGEVARHFNEKTKKYIFDEFGAEANLRNLINTGDCAACVHILDQAMKWPRTGAGASHYGNFAETADIYGNLVSPPLLVWGALPDRMYPIVAAWARGGCPVVVGPESAFDWHRFLPGNKWDWKRWWYYDSWTRKKRPVEPAPKHMIIPVETREEAVTAVTIMCQRPVAIRDFRLIGLETYVEFSLAAFGEWPDDWPLFVRSSWELPVRYKAKMLRELADKHGWEVERLNLKRAKHPDGRLVDMETMQNEFSCMGGVYPTRVPRMFPDPEIRNYKTSYEMGVKEKKS